jgi:sterol desaturase/sphingolipid hydroxylase (fatty acid hydroxylase superfamily)
MKFVLAVIILLFGLVFAAGTRISGPEWLFWLGWTGVAVGTGMIFLSVCEVLKHLEQKEVKQHINKNK